MLDRIRSSAMVETMKTIGMFLFIIALSIDACDDGGVVVSHPTECPLTANDRAHGIGMFECAPRTPEDNTQVPMDPGCYRCLTSEFETPPEGCYVYSGTTAWSFCARSCPTGPKFPCQEN